MSYLIAVCMNDPEQRGKFTKSKWNKKEKKKRKNEKQRKRKNVKARINFHFN